MITPTTETPLPQPGPDLGFRRWDGLEDLAGMAVANAALRTRVGVLEPIDVEAMRHHYTHLVNSDPAMDCILAERDGVTVGYARAEWHDLAAGDRILRPRGGGRSRRLGTWHRGRVHPLGRSAIT